MDDTLYFEPATGVLVADKTTRSEGSIEVKWEETRPGWFVLVDAESGRTVFRPDGSEIERER
jgi:hypothetical protein